MLAPRGGLELLREIDMNQQHKKAIVACVRVPQLGTYGTDCPTRETPTGKGSDLHPHFWPSLMIARRNQEPKSGQADPVVHSSMRNCPSSSTKRRSSTWGGFIPCFSMSARISAR